jgi:hypothetical protein
MPNVDNLFLGRYQLMKQVGRGGMAAVFLATDIQTRRQVAIKVLSTQPVSTDQYKSRFRQEAKSLAQLSHPNIVRVLDYGEVGGRPYLVLEWMGGGTLANRMGKPIQYQEAAKLLLPIARALEYAHGQGVIHRDVKPSNILLSDIGEPLLSDFGIAKSLSQQPAPDLTGPGTGIGTPEYMAPEQGLGQPVDQRADIYSLGVILFELVSGRKPYVADTPLGTMMQATTQPLPRVREIAPEVPDEVERVLFKALAKEPGKRYQTMGELASILEKLILGEKLTSKEAPPIPKTNAKTGAPEEKEKPQKEKKERTPLAIPSWALPVGIGVVVVAALALVAVFVFKGRGAASTKLATLENLQGEVQLLDGGDTQAMSVKKGPLLAKSSHAVLKTNTGRAQLTMADGSTVWLDEGAALEFGKSESAPQSVSALFNLAGGRALVVTKNDSQSSVDVLLNNNVVVSGKQAMMGLEVISQASSTQEVDCLIGTCQVSAGGQIFGLKAGQHIHVNSDGSVGDVDGARYSSWSDLGGDLVPQPTATPTQTPEPATSTPKPTATPTEAPTTVVLPSATPTETATLTPTATNTYRPRPTATRRPTNTPTNEPPQPHEQPTNTPVPPTNTPIPPPPTNTPVPPPPTNTPVPPPPTSTPIPPTEPPPPPPTEVPPTAGAPQAAAHTPGRMPTPTPTPTPTGAPALGA